MKIHEYQAKELLAAAGAPVPRGLIARTPAEATKHFDDMWAASSRSSSRPRSTPAAAAEGAFEGSGSDIGGVKFTTRRDDVAKHAETMFKFPLVTKQTSAKGQKVSTLLVQEAADIAREIYVGMVMDRESGVPILMASAEGGVDIEEVAAKNPAAILKEPIRPELGLLPYQARKLAFQLGFVGDQVAQAEKIMMALSKVFLAKDCNLAEINPLVVTPGKGQVVVLDAKIVFDDNALFRHQGASKPSATRAKKTPPSCGRPGRGLSFIRPDRQHRLPGQRGYGLAMSTMDIIKYHGGDPANFLDVKAAALQQGPGDRGVADSVLRSARGGGAHQHLRRHHEVRHHRRRRHRGLQGSVAEGAVRGPAGGDERRAGPKDAAGERPESDAGEHGGPDRRAAKKVVAAAKKK